MKHTLLKLMALVMCLITLFSFVPAVASADEEPFPQNVTIESEKNNAFDYLEYYSGGKWKDLNTPRHWIESTGQVCYCIEHSEGNPHGASYTATPPSQVFSANKAHLHNHFVVNSVSMTGRKFYATKASYRQMRASSDRLCKEYGLSVITEHQEYYPKHYAEWDAEQNGQPTWRSSIKVDMDDAIKYSMTFQQFISEMKKKGYVLERRGSFLRIKAPGMQRFVRLRSLGAGYSEEAIQRRILRHRYPEVPPRKKVPHPRKVLFHGDFRLQKVTWKGLRALYYFYIRKLRQSQHKPIEAIPDCLRVDLRHLDAISEQSKFLVRYNLDTGEQVEALKARLKRQLTRLQVIRKKLLNSLQN